ncbi:MAG: DNA primase [Acidimicrobiia bacterium]
MGILDEDVARVRETADIVALASEHLALKRVGRRYIGLCPFHGEKSPSFSVNPELGLYYCFGCGARGDAISFVRELEHLDFVEAVERLANRSGITLRYDDVKVGKTRERNDRLVAATAAAVALYHRMLLETPEAGAARKYLRARGFDGDAARRFSLGFAPDTFDTLSVALQKQGHAREDLVEAGLAFVNRANKLQDAFRHRLMFPIFDQKGAAVGFGGRTLTGDGPKYKNSPETPIYRKHRLLYGLNWAKGEIVARGAVVVCEGYTDVMALALAGVPNAVATCGTALTEEHVGLLKNLARKVILAYDADSAGQGAAEKWYEWEQRYEIQLSVAAFPGGGDPAEVFQQDPNQLVQAVADARPFLDFKLRRELARHDRSTPEGRARAAEAVVPLLRQHPNELVREGYIAPIAGELGIEHAWFKQAVAKRGSPRRVEAPEPANAVPEPVRIDRRELEALRVALHEPERIADALDTPLFGDPIAIRAFDALATAHTVHGALDSVDGATRSVLERIAVEEPDLGDDPEAYVAELIANLGETAGSRRVRELAAAGDDDAVVGKRIVDALVRARDASDWETVGDLVRQLLAWLSNESREAV